jgi:hypothetical protein
MTSSPERLPDFFIVGHPKSGTTALYEMLKAHPQIFMPELKEPRYFATDLRARFQPTSTPEATRLQLPETLEDYLALFRPAAAGQLIGEASPSYLRSAAAAGLIAAARPDARIIAVLREPASFVRSLHLELVQNHVESEQDLRKAFANEQRAAMERSPVDGPRLPRYSDRVRYVEQLRRYEAVFAPEQMLVLIYDDFRADNEATVRRVLAFLGVDQDVPIAAIEANPTVHVRSVRMDRLVRSLYAGRGPVASAVKSTVKRLLPHEARGERLQLVRRRLLYGAPKPADESFMVELRRRFKGEVEALSEHMDRDLIAQWGYDSLD